MPPGLARIYPAWWSPRVFPYVIVLVGLGVLGAYRAIGRFPQAAALLGLVALVVAGMMGYQLRRGRILLGPGRIVFPEWRGEDASEIGMEFGGPPRPLELAEERVTVLEAGEIADWTRDRGRIVITTREEGRHGIGLGGIREADRERIVAWLVENVGG